MYIETGGVRKNSQGQGTKVRYSLIQSRSKSVYNGSIYDGSVNDDSVNDDSVYNGSI